MSKSLKDILEGPVYDAIKSSKKQYRDDVDKANRGEGKRKNPKLDSNVAYFDRRERIHKIKDSVNQMKFVKVMRGLRQKPQFGPGADKISGWKD